MSITKFIIRSNQYFDSVFLMGINKGLLSVKGVIQSAVLMGTQSNKQLLADIGVANTEIEKAGANDLMVAIIAETEPSADTALETLDQLLTNVKTEVSEIQLRTLNDAIRFNPNANLAVISVPGEFAAREAKKALNEGLNVFLFSSNVEIKDEIELKNLGKQKNLLVMGPDCGTSIIGGKGIGFANKVRSGPVGVIGPSGTGLQEFTCLIHHLGSGISHAIGTGSRDLKDDIGGITTLMALDMLEQDDSTQVVSIISKPAGEKTLIQLLTRLEKYTKPVVTCFLGVKDTIKTKKDDLIAVSTIDEAAEQTLAILGISSSSDVVALDDELLKKEASSYDDQQKYMRGLFAGGTFCYQSQQIMLNAGMEIHSNDPLKGAKKLKDPDFSVGHTLLDMGDEYYTLGKPHPMIDGTMRGLRILNEGTNPETAIILLDFILGFNSSNDPVGEAIDAILSTKHQAERKKRHLTFIASITGTEDDVQDFKLQKKLLEDAGVIVTNSNAAATGLCVKILRAKSGRHE